jgi:hypothetical protein
MLGNVVKIKFHMSHIHICVWVTALIQIVQFVLSVQFTIIFIVDLPVCVQMLPKVVKKKNMSYVAYPYLRLRPTVVH